MRSPIRLSALIFSIASALILGVAGSAHALPGDSIPGDFTLRVQTATFGLPNLSLEFSEVSNFNFMIDLDGPLEAGRRYGNDDITEARYRVSGRLNTNPPTPSGFFAFALSRLPSGEGPITPSEWEAQGSELHFEIDAGANLLDGVQLSELIPFDKGGVLLEITAVELGRLDRARYHPPQLLLYADGTGLLWNANNSSKDTGVVNPGTGLEVHVDYGDEYITRIEFDPESITIIEAPTLPVPEPGTALLLGLGLAGLARRR